MTVIYSGVMAVGIQGC